MKQQNKKKRRRSKASKNDGVCNSEAAAPCNDEDVLRRILEPFPCVSVEEAASAYKEANGDLNKAAEILGRLVESREDRSTTSSVSSWNAGSSSRLSTPEEVFGEDHKAQCGVRQKSKMKKAVASAGTVSTVLGKDYVSSTPKKNSSRLKGFNVESYSSKEDMEQFLCSMLGEESQLSFSVVRDVLCQCGYDADKALNILLELSASSVEQSKQTNTGEEALLFPESNDNFIDRISDSSSSSGSDFQENMGYAGNPCRNQLNFLDGVEHSLPRQGNSESQLSKEVLKSLFNMPTPKSAEHEPGTLNWRNVVTKMTSLGLKSEPSPANSIADPHNYAKGDDYQVFREASTCQWESMKSYYQKAASAFANGERQYAGYLADQGRAQNRKALEAEEKASQNIFEARNKSIENIITIDLHGQHVKEAMRLLKLHLLFGAFGRSVQLFRVITGCGGQGVGKSKLKLTVINLLEKEGIKWSEENRGTLLIKLHGQTNFSFLYSDSDND
nr:SMR domain-containing protein At5g58720 isoform X1 [Ipomoea batatas]